MNLIIILCISASQIKSVIPPANERKKLIPLALMFFCILFNYTILRDTKDVLMVTAPKSGAEVIPFIKTYVNLPAAIVSCHSAILILIYDVLKSTHNHLYVHFNVIRVSLPSTQSFAIDSIRRMYSTFVLFHSLSFSLLLHWLSTLMLVFSILMHL